MAMVDAELLFKFAGDVAADSATTALLIEHPVVILSRNFDAHSGQTVVRIALTPFAAAALLCFGVRRAVFPALAIPAFLALRVQAIR